MTCSPPAGAPPVDQLIAALPARGGGPRGAGAHGPRTTTGPGTIRIAWTPGRGHWVLARRSITDPSEIAYYICFGPRGSSLRDLVRVAGARWRVEECFQTAKNEVGLDHYQVRRYAPGMPTSPWPCSPWPGWPARKPLPQKGNRRPRPRHDQLHATGDPPTARAPDPATRPRTRPRLDLVTLARRRQHQARVSHYRTRDYHHKCRCECCISAATPSRVYQPIHRQRDADRLRNLETNRPHLHYT